MRAGILQVVAWTSFALPLSGAQLWRNDGRDQTSYHLSQIDLTTGQKLRSIAIDSGLTSASISDLASDPVRQPSIIWAICSSSPHSELLAIDPIQGTLHFATLLDIPASNAAIAIDPTTGIMYGTAGKLLFRIDPQSGTTTRIGVSNIDGWMDYGLGFDAFGNLFASDGLNLFLVNKSTGIASYLYSGPYETRDLATDPETGKVYLFATRGGLFQMNLASGVFMRIGGGIFRSQEGIAFIAVPEPNCLLPCVLLLLPLLTQRRPRDWVG